jgi:hypothetical protein
MKRESERLTFVRIDGAGWQRRCIARLHATHPEVSPKEAALLAEALRVDPYLGTLKPSEAVDSWFDDGFLP